MVKKVIKIILFIIIALIVLFGIAILFDKPSSAGVYNHEWLYKFMEFTDGFGYIIGHGLRLLTQFFP